MYFVLQNQCPSRGRAKRSVELQDDDDTHDIKNGTEGENEIESRQEEGFQQTLQNVAGITNVYRGIRLVLPGEMEADALYRK